MNRFGNIWTLALKIKWGLLCVPIYLLNLESSFKLIRHQIYVHVSRAQRKQWHQSLLDFFPPLSYISPIILKFTHNPISFQYYQSSFGKQWPTILHEILVRMREVKRRVCLIFRSGAEKNIMIFKMFLLWCTTN